ncbi:hypothetical protein ASE67_07610 [Sphingomonas sp. Leaf23]|nr:hypothetical protein ASE67_07610 [Sphingomonas sp. Leaf23]
MVCGAGEVTVSLISPDRTPAEAGVQLGDGCDPLSAFPNWAPAFAGVRTGVMSRAASGVAAVARRIATAVW